MILVYRYGEHNATAPLAVAQGLDPTSCPGGVWAAEYGDRIVRAGCPLEAVAGVMECVARRVRELLEAEGAGEEEERAK